MSNQSKSKIHTRADKMLWMIRLSKTRSQAVLLIEKKKVQVNDLLVKPSSKIHVGDQIEINYNAYLKTFKVIGIPKTRVGAALVETYIIETTPKEELVKMEKHLLMMTELRKQGRGRGIKGRPEKKDRRALDDFLSDTD
ncbi:MAG TPA: S4 domain-containing protein [Bacteroidia bacterium]|nr:S4 domain-containing protein [Bacteroidia bacterium]HNT80151.1 S4 domain-containing protein [Bacteroidia bacterium]